MKINRDSLPALRFVDDMDGDGWVARALIATPSNRPAVILVEIDCGAFTSTLEIRDDEIGDLIDLLSAAQKALAQ